MISERGEQEATDLAILARLEPDHPEAARLALLDRRRALCRDATLGVREARGTLEVARERFLGADRQDRAADIDRALEILDDLL